MSAWVEIPHLMCDFVLNQAEHNKLEFVYEPKLEEKKPEAKLTMGCREC